MSQRTAVSRPRATPRAMMNTVTAMNTVCHSRIAHGLARKASKAACDAAPSAPSNVPLARRPT